MYPKPIGTSSLSSPPASRIPSLGLIYPPIPSTLIVASTPHSAIAPMPILYAPLPIAVMIALIHDDKRSPGEIWLSTPFFLRSQKGPNGCTVRQKLCRYDFHQLSSFLHMSGSDSIRVNILLGHLRRFLLLKWHVEARSGNLIADCQFGRSEIERISLFLITISPFLGNRLLSDLFLAASLFV